MPINKRNYNNPKFLKRGDQIEIIASARYFSRKELLLAINNIESFGYSVKCDINFDNKKDIFADSKTNNRLTYLNQADIEDVQFFMKLQKGDVIKNIVRVIVIENL